MFAGGYASGGRDHFDTSTPLYQFIAQLASLRKANKVLSRGTPAILDQNSTGPGAFVYKMTYQSATAIVAINTSDSDTATGTLKTGLPSGMVLANRVATGTAPQRLVVAADGTVTTSLPPRSAFVWMTAE
jgi:hypothetical protein